MNPIFKLSFMLLNMNVLKSSFEHTRIYHKRWYCFFYQNIFHCEQSFKCSKFSNCIELAKYMIIDQKEWQIFIIGKFLTSVFIYVTSAFLWSHLLFLKSFITIFHICYTFWIYNELIIYKIMKWAISRINQTYSFILYFTLFGITYSFKVFLSYLRC